MSEETVSLRLRALRKEAKIGLREIARELGMPTSSYEHYEKLYKEPYLPMDFAVRLAELFARLRGVEPHVILALAGSAAPIEGQTIDERVRGLSARRQQNVLGLLADLERAEALDRDRLEKAPDVGD